MQKKTQIMDDRQVQRTITRIAHEIIERNKGVDDVVLVGIQRRGVPLAEKIADAFDCEVEIIPQKSPVEYY